MVKSEYFSLGFSENVSKFVILRRDIGKIRSLCKFCRVSLNIQKTKTELKLAKAQNFGIHKNVTVPIIVMLGHSEVDMKVLSTGIETIESNDCREMLEDNEDANRVLPVM